MMRAMYLSGLAIASIIIVACGKSEDLRHSEKINFYVDNNPVIQESDPKKIDALYTSHKPLMVKLDKACLFVSFIGSRTKFSEKDESFKDKEILSKSSMPIAEIKLSDEIIKCQSAYEYFEKGTPLSSCEIRQGDASHAQEQYLLDLDAYLRQNYGMSKSISWELNDSQYIKSKKEESAIKFVQNIQLKNNTIYCSTDILELERSNK